MSVYVLQVKNDLAKKRLAALGDSFLAYRKVVNASSVSEARSMAAEQAKEMGEFDNPRAWLSNIVTSCKRITPHTDAGVISSEYV
jgi:hypothetical protein